MPECHSCPSYLNPALKSLPWEDTPCAKCKSTELSNKGRSHVSGDSSEAVGVEEAMQEFSQPLHEIQHPVMEKLAGFLTQLMALPAITRDIVAYRFIHPDRPISQVASRHNITTQAAHSRLKKALERVPVLSEVTKMRTNHGGKNETDSQ